MEKRFVPQKSAKSKRNWCAPYATAALVGKDYDEVYATYCKVLKRNVKGVTRSEVLKVLRALGVNTDYAPIKNTKWAWLNDGARDNDIPPLTLTHVAKWIKAFKKYNIVFSDVRYFMLEVTEHEMLWDDVDKLVLDNHSMEWVKPEDHRWKRKYIKAYAPVPAIEKRKNVKQVGQSDEAKRKKVYYNRVRRTCKKYGIKISYVGKHKNYTNIQLHVPIKFKGQNLYGVHGVLTWGVANNDIDWEKIHNYLLSKGYKGGAK